MQKTKVLVTGAFGFLGSAVCDEIKKHEQYELQALPGREAGDLNDESYCNSIINYHSPDIVVHLAARIGGIQANKKNPGLFIYENLAMGVNLIETCRKYGKLKKFVMVGTVCSYPKFTPVPFKESDIWNGYPEETNAPYGIAKKALIELLIAYKEQYNFNCSNLIPVNMYGPRDNFHPDISHVIPATILKCQKAINENSKEINIWGTGKASREFLYVEDSAQAIVKSLDVDTPPDPINIGTGKETSIKNLAHMIADEMGYGGDIVFNSQFPDGQPRRCLDTTRAKEVLGFEAETDFKSGLSKTIAWFRNNEDKFSDYYNNIQ